MGRGGREEERRVPVVLKPDAKASEMPEPKFERETKGTISPRLASFEKNKQTHGAYVMDPQGPDALILKPGSPVRGDVRHRLLDGARLGVAYFQIW